MRNLNVLVVSHLFPSNSRSTDGLFVYAQVQALRRHACIQVISPTMYVPAWLRRHTKYSGYFNVPDRANYGGVKVEYPRYLCLPGGWDLAWRGWVAYHSIQPLVQALHQGKNFDLIHAHTAIVDGEVARRLSADLGIPYVVTIHGEDFQRHIYRDSLSRKVVTRACASAGACLTVSEKLRQIGTKELGLGNVRTIYNGVHLIDRVNDLQRKPTNNLRVIAVGNLIRTKGFDTLLRAFALVRSKIPNTECHIIGEGPEARSLIRLADALGIQGSVSFHGKLPNELVQRWMQNADIFVLPSYSEAFGVVYLEAMGHGLPVIGCKGQGVAEIIVEGSTGFTVIPHDNESLATMMTDLLRNANLRQRIGDAGCRLVRETFTWERNAAAYIEAYHEVLGTISASER